MKVLWAQTMETYSESESRIRTFSVKSIYENSLFSWTVVIWRSVVLTWDYSTFKWDGGAMSFFFVLTVTIQCFDDLSAHFILNSILYLDDLVMPPPPPPFEFNFSYPTLQIIYYPPPPQLILNWIAHTPHYKLFISPLLPNYFWKWNSRHTFLSCFCVLAMKCTFYHRTNLPVAFNVVNCKDNL